MKYAASATPDASPSTTPSIGNGLAPSNHHAATPTGTMTSEAASNPMVAVRRGSPAVLRRTFHARCRTAETATRPMTQGSTPGRYLPISRRVRPNAQAATPPTTTIAAATIPTGSYVPAIG